MSGLLTISEVARRSGVAASALRFYEERGLVKSERAGSGHRRYPRAVLRRIAFIVFAQRMGLTLEEVGAELAKLPENRVPERTDWRKSLRVGQSVLMSGLLSSSASGWASPDALVAAACHYRTVNLLTLVIGPADSVPVLAIGLVTKDFKSKCIDSK